MMPLLFCQQLLRPPQFAQLYHAGQWSVVSGQWSVHSWRCIVSGDLRETGRFSRWVKSIATKSFSDALTTDN
jgi:hypothetical protein